MPNPPPPLGYDLEGANRARKQRNVALTVAVIFAVILAVVVANRQETPIVPSAPAINYNSNRICAGAFEEGRDYSKSGVTHFTIELTEGCWSGWVTIPWNPWYFQLNEVDDWMAVWYSGGSPTGPRRSGSENLFPEHPPTRIVRLQGHGTLTIYTNVK